MRTTRVMVPLHGGMGFGSEAIRDRGLSVARRAGQEAQERRRAAALVPLAPEPGAGAGARTGMPVGAGAGGIAGSAGPLGTPSQHGPTGSQGTPSQHGPTGSHGAIGTSTMAGSSGPKAGTSAAMKGEPTGANPGGAANAGHRAASDGSHAASSGIPGIAMDTKAAVAAAFAGEAAQAREAAASSHSPSPRDERDDTHASVPMGGAHAARTANAPRGGPATRGMGGAVGSSASNGASGGGDAGAGTSAGGSNAAGSANAAMNTNTHAHAHTNSPSGAKTASGARVPATAPVGFQPSAGLAAIAASRVPAPMIVGPVRRIRATCALVLDLVVLACSLVLAGVLTYARGGGAVGVRALHEIDAATAGALLPQLSGARVLWAGFALEAAVSAAALLFLCQLLSVSFFHSTLGRFVVGVELDPHQRRFGHRFAMAVAEVATAGGIFSLPFVLLTPKRVPIFAWLKLVRGA